MQCLSERLTQTGWKTPCLPNHYTCGTLLWYLLYFVGPVEGRRSEQKKSWLETCIGYVLSSRTSNLLLKLDTWLNHNSFACLCLFISSLTSHKGKFCFLWSLYRFTASVLHMMRTRDCAFVKSSLVFLNIFGPTNPLNPLNPELNPICYLLALLGAHHFLHVSRIRVNLLTFRLLMSYIWSTHSWCF